MLSPAGRLLDLLSGLGVEVSSQDGSVHYRPKHRVGPKLLVQMKDEKRGLAMSTRSAPITRTSCRGTPV